MRDSTDDTGVEDENPTPNRTKGKTPLGLVIGIGLFLVIAIGIFAYAQYRRAEDLAGQLKSVAVEQQPKPRQQALSDEARTTIIAALRGVDSGVPAPVVVAVDAGKADAMPPAKKAEEKPLTKKVEVKPLPSPEPSVPVVLPEFDGTGHAVQVHTLWKKWQPWYEKQDTAKGLAKCSRTQKIDLELFIRQAKGKSKMTALVEGYPVMDEDKAKQVAICLDSAIKVPGQENHFEVVKASDFADGFASVVIPDKETPPP